MAGSRNSNLTEEEFSGKIFEALNRKECIDNTQNLESADVFILTAD